MLKKYLRKGSLVAGLMALALVLSLLPANVAKAATISGWSYGINTNGEFGDSFEHGDTVINFDTTSSGSIESTSGSGSTITIRNLNLPGTLSVWQGGYTVVFEGTNTVNTLAPDSPVTVSVADGSTLTINSWFNNGNMTIDSSVTSSPSTPVEGSPVTFSGRASSETPASSSDSSSESSASAATPAADTQAMEKAAQAQTTQNFVNAVVKQNTATSYTYGSVNAASAGGTLPVGGVITMGNPSDADYARADAAILPIIGNAQKMVKEVNVNDLNGNLVHDFGGNVTLSAPLPFAIAPGKTMAVYVIEGNNAVGLPSYVDGDRVFWTTPHCSTFVFVEADQPAVVGSAATSGAVTSPKTANDMGIYLLMLAIAAASLAGVFMIKKRS